MKKILLTLFTLTLLITAFAQADSTKFRKLMFSIGIDKAFINSKNFDAWLAKHNTDKQAQDVTGNIDISLTTKKYDFGVSAVFPDPYCVGSLYFGRRLTNFKSKFSTFLNIHAGYFDALYEHTAPAYITPPPSNPGKPTLLQYNSGYVGLSLKNYFTSYLKKAGTSNIGFDLDMGYTAWTNGWKYGFYSGPGRHSHFKGTHVHQIPPPGKFFINFSIFYGLGTS